MNSKIVLDVIKPKQGPDKKWKAMVPSKEVIGCVYETSLPSDQITFLELKKFLQKNTKDFFSKKKIPGTHKKLIAPTAGSFNNCNGRWLEYIFAIYAWNALAEINQANPDIDPYIYIKLPNSTIANAPNHEERISESWTSILDEVHIERIERKKTDLFEDGNSKLEASNPDAMILRLPRDDYSKNFSPYSKIGNISLDTQNEIDSLFSKYVGKVHKLEEIIAFISIKASTRSDRRYQFIVEGNSTKGLYATAFSKESDLKVGKLMMNKYYAFALEPSKPADHEALDGLIMFASLFNEAVGATRAIDALYDCETPSQVTEKIKLICT